METFWLSPDDYVTGDPTLRIDHPYFDQPHTAVKCSRLGGDAKWISMAIHLPPGARVEALIVCYQVSNSRSYISQIRLSELSTPDASTVRHDDSTKLDSTTPVCYRSRVTAFATASALSLELRLEFADLADVIMLGGVGVGILASCDVEENRHSLGEFGPYDTLDKLDQDAR